MYTNINQRYVYRYVFHMLLYHTNNVCVYKYMTIYIHTQKYTYLNKRDLNKHSSLRIKLVMSHCFNNSL